MLSFVFTRPTDRRSSLIHWCMPSLSYLNVGTSLSDRERRTLGLAGETDVGVSIGVAVGTRVASDSVDHALTCHPTVDGNVPAVNKTASPHRGRSWRVRCTSDGLCFYIWNKVAAWSIFAQVVPRLSGPHVEQERIKLCRIGNRKDLEKSDDVCCSHWRSANKRRSDSVCQRIRFILESKVFSKVTPVVLSRGKLCEDQRYSYTSGPVARNHNSSKMADG